MCNHELTEGRTTTLCYLKRDGHTLMLYRNKKKDDVNAGKWIGVGGKVEPGEDPDEAVLREIREETGYTSGHCNFRGIVIFCYNDNPPETMYLYTAEDFFGEMRDCDEGTLKWIRDEDITSLNLWEGDRIFLNLIGYDCDTSFVDRAICDKEKNECTSKYANPEKNFRLTLRYHDDRLTDYKIDVLFAK